MLSRVLGGDILAGVGVLAVRRVLGWEGLVLVG